jgi:hypothetical protein
MQILRFDEEETPAPKRKRTSGPSKGLLVVPAVAVLFGVGTAFASSTISINGNAPVTLGQGVTQVTGCDSAISVTTAAGLDTPTKTLEQASATPTAVQPSFYLNNLVLSAIDNNSFNATTGTGCGGKYLAIQIFHSTAGVSAGTTKETARTCSELGYAADPSSSKPNASLPTNGATETCSKSIIYVLIPSTSPSANYSTTLNFPTSVSSDLDFVTVVSTDSVV